MAYQHCDNCTKGVLSEGNPTGQTTKFGGVDAYIAGNLESKKSAIVIATDVFGYSFINIQVMADTMTKQTGVPTVVPDIFDNFPLPINAMSLEQEARTKLFVEWRPKQGRPDGKLPIFHAVFKELKEKGIEKIGLVGYCYGGRIAALLASDASITCSIIAHPSGVAVPDEVNTMKVPTLWICAEVDQTFPTEARKGAQEVLEKKGIKNVFKDYPGTEHGFAVRGEEKSEESKNAKLAALDETIKFLAQEL